MIRPSWEKYALLLANTAKLRSKDPYLKVGACVLRHDYSVAGVGYNGPPPGIEINWDDRDARRLRIIHAEANALRYCKPNECLLLATTLLPCNSCLTLISSYGIKIIVYQNIYERDNSTLELAKEFKIELRKIESDSSFLGSLNGAQHGVLNRSGVQIY